MSTRDRQRYQRQVEAIQQAVADAFGLSIGQLTQANLARSVAIPRQIAMYLVKQLTEATALEIGEYFGKHYTTVMYAVLKIENERHNSPEVDSMVNRLLRTIAFK